MTEAAYRCGFIAVVGRPNVGKSTLTNALIGSKITIVSRKAQTTRHRILGFVNGDDFQVIFSDTPGIIKPLSRNVPCFLFSASHKELKCGPQYKHLRLQILSK